MPPSPQSIPRRSDFGVGKWSRIATYGTKRQQQDDESWRTFEFNDAAFVQALQNFRRMFAGRGKGMGSDYEHQTLYAPQNGQPAPNLCFWGAMAVIDQSGQVSGLEDLRGDSPPIDPMAERVRLAEQNPAEDSDPAGVWVLCSEITPLGEKLIPNYSQLSPLFNDSDVDEHSQPVGFAFQNVSFVNVAFQGRTSFNFAKGQGSMNEPQAPDMMGKLSKFGYLPDKPESAETAYNAYMEGSDDSAEERKKTAEMYRQMRAKMAAAEVQSGGPGTLPAGAPPAAPPELAAPGLMGKPVDDKDADGMAKMSKIIQPLVQRVEIAEKNAAAAMAKLQDKEKAEHAGRVTAFRKEMLEGDNARYLPEQASMLDALLDDVGGDVDKARKHAEMLPPVAAFSRLTMGGNPVGMKTVTPPGIAGMNKSQKGVAFNKAVRELRTKEPSLSFADAQQRVATEQPELYAGSL